MRKGGGLEEGGSGGIELQAGFTGGRALLLFCFCCFLNASRGFPGCLSELFSDKNEFFIDFVKKL